MRRLLLVLAFCYFAATLVSGQTAIVKRNVVLRARASTSSKRMTMLQPRAKLTLISPRARNGFIHITTEDGDKGWVWINNVEVQDEGDAAEGNAETTPADNDLLNKLLAAHTEAAGQPLVENGEAVCGPTGDATDDHRKNLNRQKNRTDIPNDTAYVPINWIALRDLPSDRADDLPGAPVIVEGFLVHRIKVENDGSGESTNCHLPGEDEVDWYIYMTETGGMDDISQAVIVRNHLANKATP